MPQVCLKCTILVKRSTILYKGIPQLKVLDTGLLKYVEGPPTDLISHFMSLAKYFIISVVCSTIDGTQRAC